MNQSQTGPQTFEDLTDDQLLGQGRVKRAQFVKAQQEADDRQTQYWYVRGVLKKRGLLRLLDSEVA